MPYFFWTTGDWFSAVLCCRYLFVRLDKLRMPMLRVGAVRYEEWHWALGFFTDGQFQVLGAWPDEGEGTAQRIAKDLHDRGVERVHAVAAEDSLLQALEALLPKVCSNTTAQLLEPDVLDSRMHGPVRWTEVAWPHLQGRVSRAAKREGPFADRGAAADFLSKAFQRVSHDLLDDRYVGWNKRSARFGQDAFTAYRGRAA
ncbi:transposase [Pelomonas cellulosilytica]|uniref:Transposase n=1 Tax=Pelomonas cellulosilytica TaxID=2906762 RepID=A0ABS8XSZ8_9BURK|nr:transposase [Pelomonas sp. P8]MCE4554022.1 transposase [Pelomonas sp. P8]